MRKLRYLLSVLAFVLFGSSASGQPFSFPAGRIAMSFDGNLHDDDDIIALPVSLGIINAAGLSSKLVHVEYNNNTCGNANTVDYDGGDYADKPEFEGIDANHMATSAQGMIDRYGFSSSVMFNRIINPAGTESHLRSEINKSTSANPLFIMAAGPMETIWRAINGSNASAHPYVYIISHGRWNEDYYRADCSPHTWSSIGSNFPAIKRVAIPDQNYRLNRQLSTNEWDWMRTSSDANLRWMYTRNPFVSKFDPSDAGMAYYIVSNGGKIVNGAMSGGNQTPTITDIKNLLTNPASTGGNVLPVISFTKPLNNANLPAPATLVANVTASDPDGSIVSVDLYLNGTFVRKELVSPYDWNHINQDPVLSNMPAGVYVLKAVATDNKGATNSAEISISIGTVATGVPVVSFTQPVNGTNTGKNIVASVNASDPDGFISNVKLYLDGVFIRQENTAPYVWNSTNGGSLDAALANLSAGTHQLKAIATDNVGKTAESTISITVLSSVKIALTESGVETETLEAYPNPFKDMFTIQVGSTNEIYSARLIASNGSAMKATFTIKNNTIEFSTAELESGIYLVEVVTLNGTFIKKVMKE